MKHSDNARKMLEMRMDGATYQEIGDKFNISRQGAHQIVSNYCNAITGVRGQGFNVRNIKYEAIRDYFLNNLEESVTSFTEKIFGSNCGSKIQTMKNFLTGKSDSRFTVTQIKRICEIVGSTFEEVFKESEEMVGEG